jgi:lipoate-protein ligase A
MAVDEAILLAVSQGQAPPTIRFYSWQPAAISIGYFQRAHTEVDHEQLQANGLGFVRRPTGGRAVLHHHELTYSIIVSESESFIPRTVNEAYRVLSEGLVRGFRKIGLLAEMISFAQKQQTTSFQTSNEEKERSAACFDAPSWYELVVEGRKIAGSAQTRQKGVLLQHGSILLEFEVEHFLQFLRFRDDQQRQHWKKTLMNNAVAINDLRRSKGQPILAVSDLIEPFRNGLAEALSIPLYDGDLTPIEEKMVQQLMREKYATATWNFRK